MVVVAGSGMDTSVSMDTDAIQVLEVYVQYWCMCNTGVSHVSSIHHTGKVRVLHIHAIRITYCISPA